MASKKEQTHQKILKSMHKTFRQHGYNGAGVNGLASEAGVTSGAFYAHFGSKSGAFKEVITEGVSQFDQGLKHYQAQYGESWLQEFVAFYLGEKRRTDLNDSCALQSLTPEVVRSDDETKALFQQELLKAAHTMSAKTMSDKAVSDKTMSAQEETDLANETQQIDAKTWATLAMIIGGATLARAVKDSDLADEIAKSVENIMQS